MNDRAERFNQRKQDQRYERTGDEGGEGAKHGSCHDLPPTGFLHRPG
jgi:hypothetical protein